MYNPSPWDYGYLTGTHALTFDVLCSRIELLQLLDFIISIICYIGSFCPWRERVSQNPTP